MTPESINRLRDIALDGGGSEEARIQAVEALEQWRSADAIDTLLELAGRSHEPAAILRETGRALARLADRALVSQWDVRDLADAAEDGFYE